MSETLTRAQCAKLIAAARFAESIGLPFNRHWTVHSEGAGIQPHDGQSFMRRVLKSVGTAARRHGGELAALWVRENGKGKGEHAHILMNLPRGLMLANRTRRWIVAAGGTYRRNASRVRSIGGTLSSAELADDRYLLNADNVLAYLLKHGDQSATEALGLPRWGERGDHGEAVREHSEHLRGRSEAAGVCAGAGGSSILLADRVGTAASRALAR